MEVKIATGLSHIRAVNQRCILSEIVSKGTTSRTALARELSLSKPAISDNLIALLDAGLVEEVGEGITTPQGGRKPVMLRYNPNCRYVIAVDLNHSNPVFALCNLDGDILREFDIQIAPSATEKSYFSVLENGIQMLISSCGEQSSGIISIGIAAPGVFDKEGRLCGYNSNYEGMMWKNIDILQALKQRFRLPVMIKNDVKAATLGEWCSSNQQEYNSMLYVSCGIGVGVGIVLDGRLYEGQRFLAGEIYNYTDRERLRSGTSLESAICRKGLLNRVEKGLQNGARSVLSGSEITFEAIVQAYWQKDAFVCEILRDIATDLLIMVVNCVNILAIDQVVIGGEYAVFGDLIIQEFEKQFKHLCPYQPTMTLPVHSRYSGICGMVRLARERYFDSVCGIE